MSFVTYFVAHTIIIHYLAGEMTVQQLSWDGGGGGGGGGGRGNQSKLFIAIVSHTVMEMRKVVKKETPDNDKRGQIQVAADKWHISGSTEQNHDR